MSDRPGLSEAKRLLIEKSLRGGLPQAVKDTSAIPQSARAETPGRRERAVPVQTGGSRQPFFYLHGDWAGRAFYCYPLAQALGSDQPFYLLEPYNFDGLPVPPTFEAMAAAHLESMRAIQPEGPYLLGGWCNGGLIAYEMALQLLAQGQQVDLLVLMDADGPHPTHRRLIRTVTSSFCKLLRLPQGKQVDLFLLVQHVYRYLRSSRYRARFSPYRQSQNSEQSETIKQGEFEPGRDKASRLSGLARLFPTAEVLRQDWPSVYEWIAYGYVPCSLYPGKIVFFWDHEDAWRPVWWRKVIEAKGNEVEAHTLPGTHFSLRMEDTPILADLLRGYLKKVQAPAFD
jgi:thioesterase domain-containing protein